MSFRISCEEAAKLRARVLMTAIAKVIAMTLTSSRLLSEPLAQAYGRVRMSGTLVATAACSAVDRTTALSVVPGVERPR